MSPKSRLHSSSSFFFNQTQSPHFCSFSFVKFVHLPYSFSFFEFIFILQIVLQMVDLDEFINFNLLPKLPALAKIESHGKEVVCKYPTLYRDGI